MVSELQPLLDKLVTWYVLNSSPKVLLTSSQKFFSFITLVCNLEFLKNSEQTSLASLMGKVSSLQNGIQ